MNKLREWVMIKAIGDRPVIANVMFLSGIHLSAANHNAFVYDCVFLGDTKKRHRWMWLWRRFVSRFVSRL